MTDIDGGEGQLWVCAVKRRRFPVGANPTRQPLQPEATGAVMEETKCLKPSVILAQRHLRLCRIRPLWCGKAALNNLTLSLSKALAGTGVTSNGIMPGLIYTPLVEDWF